MGQDRVSVTISNDYYMMTSEVTGSLYSEIAGSDPSYNIYCGSTCPVEQVTWMQVIAFANGLSSRDGLDPVYTMNGPIVEVDWSANGWRLPTEAEWEKAALGGSTDDYAGGDNPLAVGWFVENAGEVKHPVCQKSPNALGLCDMSGNVDEWVWNSYEDPLPSGADPTGPYTSRRVYRGGSFASLSSWAPILARSQASYNEQGLFLGFRLVRAAE
jgi:formylglycine-generating enzyme required for sulfatase activity